MISAPIEYAVETCALQAVASQEVADALHRNRQNHAAQMRAMALIPVCGERNIAMAKVNESLYWSNLAIVMHHPDQVAAREATQHDQVRSIDRGEPDLHGE